MPARRLLSACLALTLLAACNAADEESAVKPASAPLQATGFITANAVTPPGAVDTRGDGVMRDGDGRPFEYALLGQKLPAFTAPMADGGTFDSAALTKWTVIDIWGAWCGDCVADGPYVDALERAIEQDPDLDFISIHVPASAERATPEEMFGKYGSLAAYFESAGYTLPVVLDADGSLRETLKVSWTPSYLLVSPDGIVRAFRTDLSVATGEPVKDFLRDIAQVKGEVRAAAAMVIGPAGIASLTGATPFTVAAVEKSFPGFAVIPVADLATGSAIFEVRPNGSDVARFLVDSDWTRGYVAAVRTHDSAVLGPAGETIGKSMLGEISPEARALCRIPEPGLLACPDPAAPDRFVRVYTLGPAGTPESAAVLHELRFLPPAP